MRVLVVDDYPDAAEIACVLLRLLGHDPIAAHSGRAAIEKAQAFQPEIAILDIGLPDLSGYEVARELRRLWAGRPMFIAAVTGWGASEDRARAFASGFDLHILKPLDQRKVERIIREASAKLARPQPVVRDPA